VKAKLRSLSRLAKTEIARQRYSAARLFGSK